MLTEQEEIDALKNELMEWKPQQPLEKFKQKFNELKTVLATPSTDASSSDVAVENQKKIDAVCIAQYTKCCEFLAATDTATNVSWNTLRNIQLIALFCVANSSSAQLIEQTIHVHIKKILIQKLTHELENWDFQQPFTLFKTKFLLLQQVLPLKETAIKYSGDSSQKEPVKYSYKLLQPNHDEYEIKLLRLHCEKLTAEHQNSLNSLLAAQYEKCCTHLSLHSPLEFTSENTWVSVGNLLTFCVNNHTEYCLENSERRNNAAKLLNPFKTEKNHVELQETLVKSHEDLLQELKNLIALAEKRKFSNHIKKFKALRDRLLGGELENAAPQQTDSSNDGEQQPLTSDFFTIKYHNAAIAVELYLEAKQAKKTAPQQTLAAYSNGVEIATTMLKTQKPFRLPRAVSAELDRIDTLIPNRRGSKLKGIALISLGVFLIGATIAVAAVTWSTGSILGLKTLPITAGVITVGITALGVAAGVSGGIYTSYKGSQFFKPKFGKDIEKCGEEYRSACRSA